MGVQVECTIRVPEVICRYRRDHDFCAMLVRLRVKKCELVFPSVNACGTQYLVVIYSFSCFGDGFLKTSRVPYEIRLMTKKVKEEW